MRPAEEEKWAPIDGFPNYLVSNLGRVRHVSCRLRPSVLRSKIGRNLKYMAVVMRVNNSRHERDIHVLVATAFCVGKLPGLIANHIDTNKRNNRADNLEWVTRSRNALHAIENGSAMGTHRSKPVIATRSGSSVGCVFRSARHAERFGFCSSHIAGCIKGRRKTHAGFFWSYAE